MKKNITILHVFNDDKFFDGVSDFFDTLDNVTNLYYYYSSKESKLKYIRRQEKIVFFNDLASYFSQFSRPDIDVVYFQHISLWGAQIIKHVDKKKKVIWWCWGFEIYQPWGIVSPVINLELYKPLTFRIYKENTTRLDFIRHPRLIKRFIYEYIDRIRTIRRVDYFSPVLPNEYELMKKKWYFKAKPFMLRRGPGGIYTGHVKYFTAGGNVLIGNSFTYTNNHLDIFEKIRNYNIAGNKFIIPINYGFDYGNDREAFKLKADLSNAIWLEDFMPYSEYEKLFSSISHAIFGHIRQQAIGNVNMCLEKGIKIFLYKDSITYDYLSKAGFAVYTIENDLTEEELSKPLTKEEADLNHRLLIQKDADIKERTERELQNMFN